MLQDALIQLGVGIGVLSLLDLKGGGGMKRDNMPLN